MKHFTVGRVALALLVSALVCLSQASVAFADGGNSANAHLCQNGNWQIMFHPDGSPFASEGDCVSYGAQGGTIIQESQARTDCVSFGGTFTPFPGSDFLWTCNGYTDVFAARTLYSDCFAGGGDAFGDGYSAGFVNTTSECALGNVL